MDWLGVENSVTVTALVVSFLVLAALESWRPVRQPTEPTERRWAAHGILFAVTTFLQGLLLRVSPLAVAAASVDRPWGLLRYGWLPEWLRVVAAILLLDGFHYVTHRLFHRFRVLWRVHEVHHSDRDYDVSTAYRFHPVEVIGTSGLYLGAIWLLAPPLAAVLFAEVQTLLVNAAVHANVALPPRIERWVRLVLITPDLHRLHHSIDIGDQNRNFGQTFVFWDRAFGTYRDVAAGGATGVEHVRQDGIGQLLAGPFRGPAN